MVHSEDIIRISLKMFEYKISINNILSILSISRTTFYKWRKKYINSSFNKSLYKQYSRKIDVNGTIQKYICDYVLKTIYLSKNKILLIIKNVKKQFNISINRCKIYGILKENNITYKRVQKEVIKNKIQKEQDINILKKIINEKGYDNIICIDETRIEEDSKPNYGWSSKNKPALMTVKLMKPKSCTAITAINNKKHIHTKFIETVNYVKKKNRGNDEKVNAITFKNFLKELFKKLDNDKEYILLMDNARIHHANIIKDFMNTTKHKIMFNIPYNPKTNPIETIFGATKKLLQYVNTTNTNKLKEQYTNILNNFDCHVYNGCYNKSFQL